MLKNYRINIHHPNLLVKRSEFYKLQQYHSDLQKTIFIATNQQFNIPLIWWFFEPYIEITWMSSDRTISDSLVLEIKNLWSKILPGAIFEYKTPEDGDFADWYCDSEEERFFGAVRHSLSCTWVVNYIQNHKSVNAGKGLKKQVGRTIHTICNPLGLTYWEEAKICFDRGIICILFCFFKFKTAIWIYEKILRRKY